MAGARSSVYKELKEAAFLANMEIPKLKLAIFTFGNVSAYDPKLGALAIKPSGVPYSELKVEDMVVLDLEGAVIEGKLRPSSDTKTHVVLYRTFKNIRGVCHTHSPNAVAWCQAGRSIPVYGTTHADHTHLPIPLAPIMSKQAVKGDYEHETGLQIVRCFEHIDPDECPMVLVEGHGPFAWGTSAEKALYHAAVLEEVAGMAANTELLNPKAKPLPDYLIRKHYERKHGSGAYYGQEGY